MTSVYFFSLYQKVCLLDGVAVDHLCALRKLALRDGDVRVDRNRLQTQTLEESEAQEYIATQDPPYQHLLVVDFHYLNREVCGEDHAHWPPSPGPATGYIAPKKTVLGGSARRRLPQRQLIAVLLELVAQRFHLRLEEQHFFREIRNARFEARGTDALVRTVLPWLARLFLVGSRDLGILELERSGRIHRARPKKERTNAANLPKKTPPFF
jgi:hypothetical protein